jgi:phosphatidylserine decarboxylase
VTDHLVIAPADGRVLSTGIVPVPDDLDLPKGEWRRISIFMNVFDVHVNRAPVAGKVIATSYHKGAFLNASLDKASEQNERQNMVLEMASGQPVGVVQIAGLVARRILLEAAVGDYLNIGQQYGIIRFGSRVDVWLPATTPVYVLAGQTTIAGETILADLSGKTGRNHRWGLPVMSERPQKKKRFRSVSIYWLLPNILTVAGFASGLTALRFAMDGRWAGVIVLISVAAVFDALDGRTARRFQTSSAFGACA